MMSDSDYDADVSASDSESDGGSDDHTSENVSHFGDCQICETKVSEITCDVYGEYQCVRCMHE